MSQSRKVEDEGPYLGMMLHKGRVKGRAHYPGEKGLFSLGAPGTGKTTSLVISNVAHLPRSMLIIDPKGEIAAITARKRAKMGRVLMLNPFGLFEKELPHLKSHGFNAQATLNPKDPATFVDEACAQAEAIIKMDNKNQSYFPEAARDAVAAFTMHARMTIGETANYLDVRKMLTAPTTYDGDDVAIGGFLKTLDDMSKCGYHPIANKIGNLIEQSNTKSGITGGTRDVIASATKGTRFLDSPPIALDMQGPAFDFADMRREIITVYLILPTNQLVTHDIWLRLVINCALRALYQPAPIDEPQNLPPVLFVLDEFAALGKLEVIETALGICRGSRVQLWPFLQDLNQLRDVYGDARWSSFLSSAGAITSFAPKDWFTANELSKLLGKKTEYIRSQNQNGRGDGGINDNPQAFPLMSPEDLMRMPPGQMVCLVEPSPFPFFTQALPYTKTPFDVDLDPNPYFRKRAA